MKLAAPLLLSLLLSSAWCTAVGAEKTAEQTNTPTNLSVSSMYQLLAAEMALDRNQPDIALANYIAAAKETQDPSIAARATQIALTVSSLETALIPAVIWAKNDLKDMEAQVTVGALYIRLNQVNQAIPYLRKSAQLEPNEAYQYFLILFKQLQKDEESQRVVQALEAMLQDNPVPASAAIALSEIYLFQGDNAKALKLCQTALNSQPDSTPGIELCTEALLRTQGKMQAKNFISQKTAALKENTDLQQFYIQFLLDNNEPLLARENLMRLTEQSKLSSEALLNNARICLQAQWYDLGDKLLKEAAKDPEARPLAYYFLARSDEMQDKPLEAVKAYQEVTDGPFHVMSQIRASMLLTEKKQYDDALKILNEAQPNDDNDFKQLVLANIDVLNKANRNQEALQKLDDVLRLNAEDIDMLYARSLVANKLNNLKQTENDLKAILAIAPTHVDALNALGFVLANQTNRYQESYEYLSKALALSPNNAQVLDSIGWLYYKMGKYQEALQSLQKALELSPDAEIAAHLGEVMWQMKDFEGAKKVWNDALQQYPTHQEILDAMKRLMHSPQKNLQKQMLPAKQ